MDINASAFKLRLSFDFSTSILKLHTIKFVFSLAVVTYAIVALINFFPQNMVNSKLTLLAKEMNHRLMNTLLKDMLSSQIGPNTHPYEEDLLPKEPGSFSFGNLDIFIHKCPQPSRYPACIRDGVAENTFRVCPSGLAKCPFNRTHHHDTLKSDMHKHVKECAKKHPACKMIICPFGCTQNIDVQNLVAHLLECSKR